VGLNLNASLGETFLVEVHSKAPEGVVLHQDGDLLGALFAQHLDHVGAETLRGGVKDDGPQQKAVAGLPQFGVRGGGRREHQQLPVVAPGVLAHSIEDVGQRRAKDVLPVVLLDHLLELNQGLLRATLGVWRVEVDQILSAADFHSAGLIDLMDCKLYTLRGHEAQTAGRAGLGLDLTDLDDLLCSNSA